jgi:OHCU decarboxylase
VSEVLARWNELPAEAAELEVMSCCGSAAWARHLAARRPFESVASLITASDEIWNRLETRDWLEAFSKHPRIGERKAPDVASERSTAWSVHEQQNVSAAGEAVQSSLAGANRTYEQRFGRMFIVCATGKSATEMLDILRQRLRNDDATELRAAA